MQLSIFYIEVGIGLHKRSQSQSPTELSVPLPRQAKGSGVIDLCISNRHHEPKKEGSLEAVTKETRSCCRFRASVVSWQSVSINSSRLSGRPFASSCLRCR